MKRILTIISLLFCTLAINAQTNNITRKQSQKQNTARTGANTSNRNSSGTKVERMQKKMSTQSNKTKCFLNGYHEKTYSDGSIYKGNFLNSMFDGYGELINKDGDIYKGQFKNGKKEGDGVLIYKKHGLYSKYEGEFLNDDFNGWGTLYWRNGLLRYEGNFLNGQTMGEGTTYYDQHPKGTSAYDLLRCEGSFNGFHMTKGTIYYYTPNSDYSKYVGECDENTGYPKGNGTLYYKNGAVYEGQMYVYPHGYGRYTYPDGRVITGKFERGALVN